MAARNYIDLVGKTLKVLEALAENPGGVALKDLTARLGMVKSSVFRILYTLRELGYVEQTDPEGTYRLTLKLLGVARQVVERPTFLKVARPHMDRLRDELGESVVLAEWRGPWATIVEIRESHHPLRLSFGVGDHFPLHSTAVGKVIAAHLPMAKLESLLGAEILHGITQNTLANRSKLRTELKRVQKQGFAVDREETVEGAIRIGAPIFDSDRCVCAAISVCAPTVRFSREKRSAMIMGVKRAAAAISHGLAQAGFQCAVKRASPGR